MYIINDTYLYVALKIVRVKGVFASINFANERYIYLLFIFLSVLSHTNLRLSTAYREEYCHLSEVLHTYVKIDAYLNDLSERTSNSLI